jgi:hypothetical protein
MLFGNFCQTNNIKNIIQDLKNKGYVALNVNDMCSKIPETYKINPEDFEKVYDLYYKEFFTLVYGQIIINQLILFFILSVYMEHM